MQYTVSFYRVEADAVTPVSSETIDEVALEFYRRDAEDIILAVGAGMAEGDQPNAMTISDDLEAEVFRARLKPSA